MSHVFISYVRDDVARVDELARALKEAGLNVWLDREQIRPGQRWRDAITDAIRSGTLFVACFSRASALREKSYMNEELVLAVEELRLRATDREWFVPLRLDDGDIPQRAIGGGETLHDLHWVDLASEWSGGVASIVLAAQRSAQRAERDRRLRDLMVQSPNRRQDIRDLRRYASTISRILSRHPKRGEMPKRGSSDLAESWMLFSGELEDRIRSVERSIDRASLEYNGGVYNAFWDTVERCSVDLSRIRTLLQELAAIQARFANRLRPPTDFIYTQISYLYVRFEELVRMAQRSFEFAVIWEHRRTREVVATGFTTLGDAVDKLGAELSEALRKVSGW